MHLNSIKIEQIKEKIIPVLKKYPVDKAILFGSYAKGEATENSDIDLFIDTNGKLKGLDFVGLIEILFETTEMEIDLIDKSHIEPGSPIMKEIEKEGLVIYEKPKDYQKDD